MRDRIDRLMGSFLAGLMGLMLLAVLWQIFTRYVMGTASTVTEELARFLLIWIGLLGAAYISGQKMHLSIDILPTKLTGRKKRLLESAIDLVVIAFAVAALVIGGGRLVYISYILGQISTALQIPLAYVYAVIPLSGVLVAYYKIMDLIDRQPSTGTGTPEAVEKNNSQSN